jgi:hypothetical protein
MLRKLEGWKMLVTLTFKKFRSHPQVVTIEVPETLSIADLKKLWEFEYFINSLPVNVRLHVGVE